MADQKNQKYYYVQKTVYIDGKEKSLIVEKLGSHTVLLKKLKGEDPLEWAKKYVDELNKRENNVLLFFQLSLVIKNNFA